jgi:4'-phosphopantetheinyl transferase
MSVTSPPRGSLHLASDEVHIWCARLDVPPETSAHLDAILTADERNRSARFRFERDRRRFIVAHAVLRELLGRYLCLPPSEIHFVDNGFGKPALGPQFGNCLKFNLSHSAGLGLIAIANSEVGVDVECVRAQADYAEIARHFFSAAEVDYLTAVPSHLRVEAFFSCWTKKEAYVKGRGEGLAISLKSFSVPLTIDPARAPADVCVKSDDIDRPRCWSLYTIPPAPGYVGALAIEGTGWRLRQWQWERREEIAYSPSL